MELQPLDILNGMLSLIVVVIAFYIGMRIALKYLEYKKKEFLFVGIVAINTSEPWWPHTVSFISNLAIGERLPPQAYFLLGNILIPVALLFWLMTLVELLYTAKKKIILRIGVIYLVAYEIILVSLLVINPDLVGTLLGALDVQYSLLWIGILLTALSTVLITGLAFAYESLKSRNEEIKLKGRFLRIAFISYCAAASIDAIILSNEINLTISRVLLLISAISFYFGYIPPDWLKKTITKEKTPKTKEEKVEKKESIEEKLVKKLEKKGELSENLKKVQEILCESPRIKIEMIKACLDIDEAAFGDKIFDWGSKYDLIIEGDYFAINPDKITEFIEELNE